MLDRLLECGFLRNEEFVELDPAPIADTFFSGRSFVLTGTLESLTRNRVKSLIELAGGRVIGQVSRKTGALIAGRNPGSKHVKARELGIPILSEADFIAHLQEAGISLD